MKKITLRINLNSRAGKDAILLLCEVRRQLLAAGHSRFDVDNMLRKASFHDRAGMLDVLRRYGIEFKGDC